MNDLETVRVLYKKLLALYPRAFREQLGEAMEQTFIDVCNERKHQPAPSWYVFVLGIFAETAREIMREHMFRISQGAAMKAITTNLRLAALISLVIVMPFAVLELLSTGINQQNAPGLAVLFGVLWLLPTVFMSILMPLVRNLRAGNSILANPVSLLFKVVFLALIVIVWGSIVIDQLPCFLGVPNCD